MPAGENDHPMVLDLISRQYRICATALESFEKKVDADNEQWM